VKRWLFLLFALTSGCGTLSKPPLPKFAIGESPPSVAGGETRTSKWREADVIYLGLTKSSGPETQPAWGMVEDLQANGDKIALGWSDLPAAQQPLLERWQAGENSEPQLAEPLAIAAHREWLHRGRQLGLSQVALGPPPALLGKIRAGETLTSADHAQLPHGFQPGPDALDDFADRIATVPRLRRYNFARLLRAHLVAEQIIAQNVIQFVSGQPKTKLLVFLPNEIMIDPREVANYVGQKIRLRQMILDRTTGSPSARPQLLTRRGSRTVEIVDRAPQSTGDDCGLVAPGL
jgi:Haem-binding uptake, Tiki superfamily, ChaN